MNLMSITFSSPPPGTYIELRPNKKISVFRVTGLKILGRVGTHIFLFLEKIYILSVSEKLPVSKFRYFGKSII